MHFNIFCVSVTRVAVQVEDAASARLSRAWSDIEALPGSCRVILKLTEAIISLLQTRWQRSQEKAKIERTLTSSRYRGCASTASMQQRCVRSVHLYNIYIIVFSLGAPGQLRVLISYLYVISMD